MKLKELLMFMGPGGSGGVTVEELNVTANGTVTAPSGKAYSPVNVNVPEPTGTKQIKANGTYDVKDYAEAEVEVTDWLDLEFSDGKTRLWIDLVDDELLSPYLNFRLKGSIKINWGDGTEETVTGNNTVLKSTYIPHTYTQKGRYIISIELISGVYHGAYNITPPDLQLLSATNSHSGDNYMSACYKNCLRKMVFTDHITFDGDFSDTYAAGICLLALARNLEYVTIPQDVLRFPKQCFYNCYTLKSIQLPTQGNYTIHTSAFQGCASITKMIIPNNVTNISSKAFGDMVSCGVYDFTAFELVNESLPLTFGTDVFSGIKSNAIILFATKEIADVAKETTNLSTYATYIHYVGEEEEIV